MSASPSSAQADSQPGWIDIVTTVQQIHNLKWTSRVENPVGHTHGASNRPSGALTGGQVRPSRSELVDDYFQTAQAMMTRLEDPTSPADVCRKVIRSIEQSFLLFFTKDGGKDAEDLESNVFILECMAEGFRKELDDLDPTQAARSRLEIAPADDIDLGKLDPEETHRLASELLEAIRSSSGGVPLSSHTDAQSWLAGSSMDPTPSTVIRQMEQDDDDLPTMGKARRRSQTLQYALNLAPREDI